MHIFSFIEDEIRSITQEVFPTEQIINIIANLEFSVETPKDKEHGSVASNIAMILAKHMQSNPMEIAEKIATKFRELIYVTKAEPAKPGFINFEFTDKFWQEELIEILGIPEYGFNDMIGEGKKINVEYCSVNPTGPIHIGHTRSTIFGDALANLFEEFGYEVTREYYINDAGKQIEILARSAYLRYKEAWGENITIDEGLYPGAYLIPFGLRLKSTYDLELLKMPEDQWLPIVKQEAVQAMMEIIKDDLHLLGIHHDLFTSEYHLHLTNKIDEAYEKLKTKDLIYVGQLEAPKGQKIEDFEPREQLLFRSTAFGDDVDRPLKKSDGSWTYFAAEMGLVLDKLSRGYNELVLVIGADHAGYVKRTKALVSALSENTVPIDIKLVQLVNFMDAGVPLKMSKRKGNFLTAREVADDVGVDVLRFMMVSRKNDSVMDFDLEIAKQQSKDNPVFYIQYAHARCFSALRLIHENIPNIEELLYEDNERDEDEQRFNNLHELLSSPDELELIKTLSSFPKICETAVLHREPHRIAYFLIELAAQFHAHWNKGKENSNLRFYVEDNLDLTLARMMLLESIIIVFRNGLSIFNIEALEKM